MALYGTREHESGLREAPPIDSVVPILDYGSQLTGNIDRAVRESDVRSEIVSHNVPLSSLQGQAKAIIHAGGPSSVFERKAPQPSEGVLESGISTLGICYGMGLIVERFGGQMRRLKRREDGERTIHHEDDTIFAGTPEEQVVWMSHGDSLVKLPSGFDVIAWSDDIPAAIASHDRKIFGVQFHPEANDTEYGEQIIRNFLDIAGVEKDFTLADQIEEARRLIDERLTTGKEAIIGLSGGVDSSTATRLLEGKPYKAFYIDHGCMREGESEQVLDSLAGAGIDVTVVDAANTFFNATTTIKGRFGRTKTIGPLSTTADPEHKRIIMGDTFVRVFDECVAEEGMAHDTVLVQGTIRPDKIESGTTSKNSAKIKTHHNASPAVQELIAEGRVIEPLQYLYKDQVRAVAEALGLPEDLVRRRPFPGPGLAIRILCDTPMSWRERRHLGRLQDKVDDFLPRSMRAKVLRQRLVGVQGDDRTYKPSVALPSKVTWEDAVEIATALPGAVHGVNRVIRLLGMGTSEIGDPLSATPTRVTPETVAIAQQADLIVDGLLQESPDRAKVSQFPVMVSYQSFGIRSLRTVILRPFNTRDFMTGKPAIPGVEGLDMDPMFFAHINETIMSMMSASVAVVGVDCSTKPPGTTEGE